MTEIYIMILIFIAVSVVRHIVRRIAAVRSVSALAGGARHKTVVMSTYHLKSEEYSMHPRDRSFAVHVITSELVEHGAWETVQNRADLARSHICACFHCETFFFPEEIRQWRDARTAICPHCGKPAVIADSCHLPLTPEFLARMKAKYGKLVN